MEYVDLITSLDQIHAMKAVLKQHSQRDLLLFVFGINTGLRICDLLTLRVDQVRDAAGVKEYVFIQDAHREEMKAFYINDSMKKELAAYFSLADLNDGDYLFQSKKNHLPITRQQAYRIINHAAKEAGIEGNIGTHTLRKTFGYHAYRKGIAISIIMDILNHQSSAETMRYIGVSRHEDRFMKVDVNL